MATSLARQLKVLAAPQTDVFVRTGKKRASLLFEPAEAAKYDLKDILTIATEGLLELEAVNEEFGRFEHVLFSIGSETVERSVENKELNAKLDASIAEFLQILAPYLLLRPAHKALEWLIVRFHVHQYNIDALMLTVLPYHETNLFVRLVQIMEFQHNKKWDWLTGIQKKGVPLVKSDLLKYLSKQEWLLTFLCDELSRRATDPFILPSSHDIFLKFISSTLVGLVYHIGTDKMDNATMAVLMTCCSPCMQSSMGDYRLTAYALLAVMVQVVRLDASVRDKVAIMLARAAVKWQDDEAVKALGILLISAKAAGISDALLSYTLETPRFLQMLTKCIETNRLTELWELFYRGGLNHLLSHSSDDEAFDGEPGLKMLDVLLKQAHLKEEEKSQAVLLAVKQLLAHKDTVQEVDVWTGKLMAVVRAVEPVTWNHVLTDRGSDNKHLLERLDLLLLNDQEEVELESVPESTRLFLRLNHPNTVVRINAVTELTSKAGVAGKEAGLSREFVRESMAARLTDESPDVIRCLFLSPAASALLKSTFGEELKNILRKLLHAIQQRGTRKKWEEVESAVVGLLYEVGGMSECLPYFLLALFSGNPLICSGDSPLSALFPSVARRTSELELSALMAIVVSDFSCLPNAEISKSLRELHTRVSPATSAIPSSALYLSIRLLLDVLKKKDLLNKDENFVLLCDVLVEFMKRVRTGKEVEGDEVSGAMKMIKKGKISPVIPLGWLEEFLSSGITGGSPAARTVLLRAAKMVVLDLVTMKDEAFRKTAVILFCSLVINNVGTMVQLLLAGVEAGSDRNFILKRNILSLTGEYVGVLAPEILPDQTATTLLAVTVSCLRHGDSRVRRSGLFFLDNLLQRHSFASMEVGALLSVVVHNNDRIIMDEGMISQVLAETLTDRKNAYGSQTVKFWTELLVESLEREDTNVLVKVEVLLSLRLFDSIQFLLRLYPVLRRLLENYDNLSAIELRLLNEILARFTADGFKAESPLDGSAEKKLLDPIMDGLGLGPRLGQPAPAVTVLHNMFFFDRNKAGQEIFSVIVKEILNIYVEKLNPECAASFHRYLKHVTLPSKLVIEHLNGTTTSSRSPSPEKPVTALTKLNNPLRKRRDFWLKTALILEVIAAKKKITQLASLVAELSELIKQSVLLADDLAEFIDDVELVRQLTFSFMTYQCQRENAKEKEDIVGNIDVSGIVDCVRSSESNTTHLRGISLLSQLAKRAPMSIMQHCMSIFTLTGSTLVRSRDAYSWDVVQGIIETVLPVAMQEKNASDGETSQDRLASILVLFIDALPHIPTHRRVPLFQRLLKATIELGGIWIMVVLLAGVYAEKSLVLDGEDGDLSKRRSYPVLTLFLNEMFSGLEDEFLQNALRYCLAYTARFVFTHAEKRKPGKDLVLSVSFGKDLKKPLLHITLSSRQFLQTFTFLLSFTSSFIADHPVTAARGASSDELNLLLSDLMEIQSRAKDTLSVITDTKSVDQSEKKTWWTNLQSATSTAIMEVLGKMSWSSFAKIMQQLLTKDTAPATLKTALEELGGALALRSSQLSKDDLESLFLLVDALVGSLKENLKTIPKENVVISVQIGRFFCLKGLLNAMGKESSRVWVPVVDVASSYACAKSTHTLPVRSQALACIGTVIRVAKLGFLPSMPQYTPKTLSAMEDILRLADCPESNETEAEDEPSGKPARKRQKTGSIRAEKASAVGVVVDVLDQMVSALADFLSPYLARTLTVTVIATSLRKKLREDVRKSVEDSLGKITAVLTKQLSFRVLFTAFKETYAGFSDQKDLRLELFGLLNLSISRVKGPQVSEALSLQSDIIQLILEVLEEKDAETMTAGVNLLNALVLLMPGTTFRGLFMRIYSWAIKPDPEGTLRSEAALVRVLQFYQIVDRLTDTLKHLFTIFAATVVGHAVKTMGALHVRKNDRQLKEKNAEILVAVCDVLTKFFKYDNARYFNADQFDLLMQPLVDQLDNLPAEPNSASVTAYTDLASHVTTSICAFASCMDDESLWKPLHYQVCLKTRSELGIVRQMALRTMEAFADTLGQSYASLLPEAMTFLVELAGDEDDKVEEQCHKTRATMQRILGHDAVWNE